MPRQASTELHCIGVCRRLETELTPVEQRIAELVAVGEKNWEVAAATFTGSRPLRAISAGSTASWMRSLHRARREDIP
jgi:hypothetical protein